MNVPRRDVGAHRAMRVKWHGHATAAITDLGTTVLTDPVLTDRIGHLRRRRGPTPVLVESPDVVVLSHMHADHTHFPSLAMIPENIPIVVPSGAPDAVAGLRRYGDRLVPVNVGQTVEFGGVSITAVRADHDGRRWRRGPRSVSAVGYVFEGSVRTYFAGDTALFDGMADTTGPCDVALLPVGGWGPTLGDGHMSPSDAAQAAVAVQAALSIPMHFGTFWPIGLDRVRPEKFAAPGAEFSAAAHDRGLRAVELTPGETVSI